MTQISAVFTAIALQRLHGHSKLKVLRLRGSYYICHLLEIISYVSSIPTQTVVSKYHQTADVSVADILRQLFGLELRIDTWDISHVS